MDYNSLHKFSARPQTIMAIESVAKDDFPTYDILHNDFLYDICQYLSPATNM